MNREQAETLLAQLIFDELDEPTRADLLAYLETDAELREQLCDMRLTANLLRDGAAAAEGRPTLSDRRRTLLLRQAERMSQSNDPPVIAVLYRYPRAASLAAMVLIGVCIAMLVLPSLTGVRDRAMRFSDEVADFSGRASKEMDEMVVFEDRLMEAPASQVAATPGAVSKDRLSRTDGREGDAFGLDLGAGAGFGATVRGTDDMQAPDNPRRPTAPSATPTPKPAPSTETSGGLIVHALPDIGEPSAPRLNQPAGRSKSSESYYRNWATESAGSGGTVVLDEHDADPSGYVPLERGRDRRDGVNDIGGDMTVGGQKPAQTATEGIGQITGGTVASDIAMPGKAAGSGTTPVLGDAPTTGNLFSDTERLRDDDEDGNVELRFRQSIELAKRKHERGEVEAARRAVEESAQIVAGARVAVDRRRWDEMRDKQSALEGIINDASQSASRLANATGQTHNESTSIVDHRAELLARQEAEKGISESGPLPPASHFREYPVNSWQMASDDNLSTFALDTDTASYRLCGEYIRNGFLPPRGAVRMEEFVNAFDYNYPRNAEQTFNIEVDGAPNPFAKPGTRTVLLKVGVQGKVIGREGRKPAHLVFVVDASGSMDRPDRLPVAQYAITNINDRLSDHDKVSVVTYGTKAEVQVEAEVANDANVHRVNGKVNSIQTTGSTNLIEGVKAGYEIAARHYRPEQTNRVILMSDGAANIGEADAKAILSKVDDYRRQGIQLTTAGVGLGGYNDELLEQLANNGDGNYLFLDSPQEAERQFVQNMDANLQTIARDAKIQVEFNPARVRRYRLIGYENRDIADADFRNDAVDAGEVGSGESSTAVYELELVGPERATMDLPPIGTVYVRYRNNDTNEVEEISRVIGNGAIRQTPVTERPRFYLAATAAQFAEVLRGSPHASHVNLNEVLRVADQVSQTLPLDKRIAELRDLIRESRNLDRAP